MIFKSLVACVGVAGLLAGCGNKAADKTSADSAAMQHQAQDVRMKAVLIYADWCGSCKILDPKVNALKSAGPISGTEFVRLDYTAKDTADFMAQADALGVGSAIRARFENGVKTGLLLLVDMDDQVVLSEVNKSMDMGEIQSAVKAAAAKA